MCALNRLAATGTSTKPSSAVVTTASGRLTCQRSAELNRISVKIGASAAPKKAVLMCWAKGSPLRRANSHTPSTMNQTLIRLLPNRPKPSTSIRQATDAPPMTAPDRW